MHSALPDKLSETHSYQMVPRKRCAVQLQYKMPRTACSCVRYFLDPLILRDFDLTSICEMSARCKGLHSPNGQNFEYLKDKCLLREHATSSSNKMPLTMKKIFSDPILCGFPDFNLLCVRCLPMPQGFAYRSSDNLGD
ncbi:hypothetical protein AVEN_69719-1 [Araneus ventricosus]|uniref:Uncharacterized protein n=1 Tax=Araneus ventricosus TaxID=182803 RepID=A0A4Y2PUQ7_ARAVE|nr:hypothetical protein AVEN_69719-1 [Araneus ventricosus]